MRMHNHVRIKQYKHLSSNLSEKEILSLQEFFWATGFHYLKVDTISQGRTLIKLFLSSLDYYKNVGCITLSSGALPMNATNLYTELKQFNALQENSQNLEKFLLEAFYYDFVWIELTPSLLTSPWLGHLEQKIIDFNLASTMPILFIDYK